MINERVQGCIADTLTFAFPFISQPSRQLPDNRKTANYLLIRILRRKTRQSDSFFEKFLFLLKISMYVHF